MKNGRLVFADVREQGREGRTSQLSEAKRPSQRLSRISPAFLAIVASNKYRGKQRRRSVHKSPPSWSSLLVAVIIDGSLSWVVTPYAKGEQSTLLSSTLSTSSCPLRSFNIHVVQFQMARAPICLCGAILVWFLCRSTLLVTAQTTHPLEVLALNAVRHQLNDPFENLNWTKNDPCTSKWIGVICILDRKDGYLHVQELRLLNKNLSGKLSPELGHFTRMTILNFMWNNISGSIPNEIGNMTALKLLLLSGNKISGPLPDELGNLPSITKFQLDINYISGPIPKSFANLPNIQHFHMNNNSISGQIPPELSKLPKLVHFLLDNNNLSGYLPSELSQMPTMKIFQVNNNNFSGTEIPDSYRNMTNSTSIIFYSYYNPCPFNSTELSGTAACKAVFQISVEYPVFVTCNKDLSSNRLTGSIPTNKLPENMTTIDLSKNKLNGSIPSNFSGLPNLQRLSLENNSLNGTIPSTFWQNILFKGDTVLLLNFQNNLLSNLSGSLYPPPNVTIKLQGNPICDRSTELDIVQFCIPDGGGGLVESPANSTGSPSGCIPHSCPQFYELVPGSPVPCFCAAPLGVGMRLRSPCLSEFRPFTGLFIFYLTSNLSVNLYQLVIDSFEWEERRIRLFLKIFPQYDNDSNTFNGSELQRIVNHFATFSFPSSDIFGPYDLLNFTLLWPYGDVVIMRSGSGMSKGLLIGIVLGAISCGVSIFLAVAFFLSKTHQKFQEKVAKKKLSGKTSCKVEGVKGFSFGELETATSNFDVSSQIGQGGYGKVYKGILADGTVVAVKRAQQGSLQGEKEFFTEIELLSRVHHRNLVSLIGYCDEEGEQMLVYEFMANGSLHSLLSARFRISLGFAKRMSIALDSAKGILYLHTEADPPIIHRDIKANNILLDSKFTAKVSDFGISKLAPVSDTKGMEVSHVSTVVKGTPGYVDPEYFLTHKLTEKSDVYSLGIMFLELLTGMPPISHGRNIVREVQAACQAGTTFSIIDRDMGSYNTECVKKFMQLALKCCEDETKARPTMLEVVRELENLCSMPLQSDANQSESNASSSGTSGPAPASLYYERNTYVSTDNYVGSDLVSGAFPDIKPR
ncbi:hypothetical protein TIFTF001_009824 [Ficus carica]|uniref:non-specific serine/threonine protein kinase n=1 Tax=Ficus carica TaxID=3494 RepID=A0AA88D2X9_FICCA|nr:hypothetical protein TIFTF001_009824 [Ficus carica]